MAANAKLIADQATAAERVVLDPAEGRAAFDAHVREALGISGEEFLRRWDAGEYRDLPDIPENWPLIRLALLIPLARPDS